MTANGRPKRPSPEALLEAAGTRGARPAEDFPRRGARRRQDLRDAAVGAARASARGRRCRHRRGRDARPQRDRGACSKGFEIIPRRRVDYKGQRPRRDGPRRHPGAAPALVLVDELAHTNAPGSRHPKRYLDVEELLAAGIDVYTTVNIQHVESLNDVVAQITRVRVRETVPDSIIDRADEIEVIDLTPDDLIQRLQRGQGLCARSRPSARSSNYFSPGNLTALRELALRRTAQRVDEQMVDYMQAHAIAGPWAAGERVLVCVNEEPSASALVRYARRLADRLRAPWTALHVETARIAAAERGGARPHRRGPAAGRAARRRGRHHPRADDVADDILALRAGEQRHPHRHRQVATARAGSSCCDGSVAHDLMRRRATISVHVIARRGTDAPATARSGTAAAGSASRFDRGPTLMQPAVVAVALGVRRCCSQQFLDVAQRRARLPDRGARERRRYGLWPVAVRQRRSACSPTTSSSCRRSTPSPSPIPRTSSRCSSSCVVAVVASNLTARVRTPGGRRRAAARKTTEDLYLFSRKLAGVGDARRSAVGHRVPDRLDAEGARSCC